MSRYIVTGEFVVEIEIDDPDVIERVTGPEGDEWRSKLYDLHDVDDVLKHLAYNAVANGRRDVTMLDGWADLTRDACHMELVDVDPYTVDEAES